MGEKRKNYQYAMHEMLRKTVCVSGKQNFTDVHSFLYLFPDEKVKVSDRKKKRTPTVTYGTDTEVLCHSISD